MNESSDQPSRQSDDLPTVFEMRAVQSYNGRSARPAGSGDSQRQRRGPAGQERRRQDHAAALCLGLAKPQHGTATILGEPAWNLSASAKQLHRLRAANAAALSLDAGPPRARLHRLVLSPLEPRPGRAARADLADSAQTTGRHALVGEAQKLALVMALAHEPEFLILDEPVASLDPSARREFLQVVLEIAAGGNRSVLFSTHITRDLERVADRVAILQHGQISFFGELGELKDQIKRLRLSLDQHVARAVRHAGHLAAANRRQTWRW